MLDDAPAGTAESAPALLERLLGKGWQFDFFQAVWLLERCCAKGTVVGGRGPVADEAIRFRPEVSVGFPPTDVRRISTRPGAGGNTNYLVDVTFMGLYGVATPLPLHYAISILRSVQPYSSLPAEQVPGASADHPLRSQEEPESTPARDFLDILHHRFISLFYRAWTKYRYEVTFAMPGRDVLSDYLLWLVGCSPGCDAATLGVPPIALLRYGGLLTQHPKSAVGLEGLLSDYWGGLPVRVKQCVGRWVPLTPADMNSIGTVNCGLGVNLTVGEQVYDRSSAFNITVGPLDWKGYQAFLPGQVCFEQTRSLVRLYCGDPLSFTMEVELYAGEVPSMQLTSDERTSRLGFTSWALTGEPPATSVTFDASVTVVHEQSEAANRQAATMPDDPVYEVSATQGPRL